MALRSEKKFIDQVLKTGAKLPKEVTGQLPGVLLRLLRKRLRMTQKQLAKRTKLPQSYIASVESGKKVPPFATWEKIFRALYCSLTFLLVPEALQTDAILERQARIAAQKRVRYTAGTMALEEQLPGKGALQEMVEEETQRLLNSNTTKIWD